MRPAMSDLLTAARFLPAQFEFLGLGFAAICAFAVFWLIIWILIAIWVYRDAESRGASGVLWLIVVILLGLIGLIIYIVVRPSGPKPVYPGYAPQYGGAPRRNRPRPSSSRRSKRHRRSPGRPRPRTARGAVAPSSTWPSTSAGTAPRKACTPGADPGSERLRVRGPVGASLS